MSENSESEVEVDRYEEIVGLSLNYSTPMASRASSPLPRDKNEFSKTHFNGPIVKCSESEVVSSSTGLVASVTWPDLRYPCSLAGKNSSATTAQHLDGNLRATIPCSDTHQFFTDRLIKWFSTTFPFCRYFLQRAALQALC